MADDQTKRLQARLTEIQARLRALDEADDDASWGKSVASRGGFRQERVRLMEEAERIKAELEAGSSHT